MVKTEPVTIDGIEFRITQFAAMKALPLLTRLGKALGPALAAFKDLDLTTNVADAGPAIGNALGALDPDEAAGLAADLLASTTAILDGQRIELTPTGIDIAFSGRLPLMLKVLGQVVRVNFSDFFGGSVPGQPAPSATPANGR